MQVTQVVTGQVGDLLEVQLMPGCLPPCLIPVTGYLPPVGFDLWTLMPNHQAVLVSRNSLKHLGSIQGLRLPRHFLNVSPNCPYKWESRFLLGPL